MQLGLGHLLGQLQQFRVHGGTWIEH
jgi:hypothetical protein